MKFYFRGSPPVENYKWNWPFIGIQLYTDKSTHIKSEHYIKKKEIIFPLILRPTTSLWLPGLHIVHMFLNALSNHYYSDLSIDEKCFF
jgi:hypothetical protein